MRIEKKRLPSKICPYCHTQLIENRYRKLKCPHCGQEYDRDLVPILHAKEILTIARQ
ncbi:MAG: transposase [Crenarchaeota archaeon]|nr:transposase [Thermoproteota archaeon]